MIIYGIKTWKCIAMPAVLFLGLSVFLFLQAVRMNLTIRDEVKEYGRITCFLNETEDADIPEQMISKEALQDESSLVYEIPINVQSSEISEEISVTGIKTYMIPGELISGRYYADQVSTPEMVMNKTALSDLMGDNSEKIRTMESWLGHTLIMGNCGVKICGIIDDGSETASVYISVPAAESYLTQQGEIPKASSYCVRISDLKTLIKTQEKMKEVGISTSVDDSNYGNDCVSGFCIHYCALHKMESAVGNIAEYACVCGESEHEFVCWKYHRSGSVYVGNTLECVNSIVKVLKQI